MPGDTTIGPIHARFLMDHEELEQQLVQLLGAYETGDREIAARAYADFERMLWAHLAAEEELLFPELTRRDPEETSRLREDHQRIRARVAELGVGVDLHATSIGSIRELVQMLRAHAAHEDAVLYRWADQAFAHARGQAPAEVRP